MKAFLEDLLDYHHQMNLRLIGHVQQHSLPDKSHSLLSHLLNTHYIWNSRVQGLVPTCGIWELQPLQGMQAFDTENCKTSLRIWQTADPESSIGYRNSKGENFSNSLKEIFFHVINHANYHRAQIATDLEANGLQAVNTDYIFYKR